MADDRKPLIIAAVCGVVVVLLFISGVGFGAGDRPAGRGWTEALSGFGQAGPLGPEDLVVTAGDCTVTDSVIVVPAACTFTIAEFGGAFDFGAITKKATATFVSPGARLDVRMDIEGASVSREAELGKPMDLTVGRSGGSLSFDCGGLGPCQLELD